MGDVELKELGLEIIIWIESNGENRYDRNVACHVGNELLQFFASDRGHAFSTVISVVERVAQDYSNRE